MPIKFPFDVGRINVGRIFDGNFDGIEAPALELREQFRAFVGKRGGKEKCVYAKSHKDYARLIHPARVSKAFAASVGMRSKVHFLVRSKVHKVFLSDFSTTECSKG
jgi:hypothetical protein